MIQRAFIIILVLSLYYHLPVVLGKLDRLAQVFDNVLDENTAEWLHEEIVKLPKANGNEYGFVFPLEEEEDAPRYSPVEQFLNQLLLELYPDDSTSTTHQQQGFFYVEYWRRTKWRLVNAHQDVDERYYRRMHASGKTGYGSTFPVPEIGHVLYLKVGTQVRGPTVIWNVSRAGDFFSHDQDTEMVIVPAVPGRLTRFQGYALHGVPRPHDVFWTDQEDDASSSGQHPHEPVEEFARSVLLFNLWPFSSEHHKPGLTLSNGTTADASLSAKIQHKSNPIQDWKEVQIEALPPAVYPTSNNEAATTISQFKIPLLGCAERRGTKDLSVRLETQTTLAREAFAQDQKVTSAIVRAEKPNKKKWFSFMGVEF